MRMLADVIYLRGYKRQTWLTRVHDTERRPLSARVQRRLQTRVRHGNTGFKRIPRGDVRKGSCHLPMPELCDPIIMTR